MILNSTSLTDSIGRCLVGLPRCSKVLGVIRLNKYKLFVSSFLQSDIAGIPRIFTVSVSPLKLQYISLANLRKFFCEPSMFSIN